MQWLYIISQLGVTALTCMLFTCICRSIQCIYMWIEHRVCTVYSSNVYTSKAMQFCIVYIGNAGLEGGEDCDWRLE